MYRDFGGVEFLEDEMRAILETIAPELEEMDEGTCEELMRDIRANLPRGRFGPEELH